MRLRIDNSGMAPQARHDPDYEGVMRTVPGYKERVLQAGRLPVRMAVLEGLFVQALQGLHGRGLGSQGKGS